MAKHAWLYCGKQFDFEKTAGFCPYCGGVVLHSAEQAVYAREQLRTDRNSVYIDTKK